jgi:hypothetical protein
MNTIVESLQITAKITSFEIRKEILIAEAKPLKEEALLLDSIPHLDKEIRSYLEARMKHISERMTDIKNASKQLKKEVEAFMGKNAKIRLLNNISKN